MIHSVQHATFTIQRRFTASLPRLWRAFSTDAKRQWTTCMEGMETTDFHMDFRPGGTELNRVRAATGTIHLFEATYLDIVPEVRLIYAYAMSLDDTRISTSQAILEFRTEGTGSAFTYTEQIAFLDGHQSPEDRISGTGAGFDVLENWLQRV
jgi:uncharacterized protein YndB with AHSA1/START domain